MIGESRTDGEEEPALTPPGSLPDAPSTEAMRNADDDDYADADADADFRDAASFVARGVRGKNIFIGKTTFRDFSDRDRAQRFVPRVDMTNLVRELECHFVEPAEFRTLVQQLEHNSIAVVVGRLGTGRRAAALMSMRTTHREPLFRLPADLPIADLVDEIERTCDDYPRAGFLIEQIDASAMTSLTGFDGHRLATTAGTTGAAVVLTTEFDHTAREENFRAVHLSVPDAMQVVRTRAAERDLSAETMQRVVEVLRLLGDGVRPGSALEALDLAVEQPGQDPEELAARVAGSDVTNRLDQWFDNEQPALSVAALTVASALEGLNVSDAWQETRAFARELDPGPPDDSQAKPKTFTRGSGTWPEHLVEVTQTSVGTHFGRHATEVVRVAPPLTRFAVIDYLWTHLGPDFREPLMRWLVRIAELDRLRTGAAITAGTIFVCDPVAAEREILRRWALNDRRSLNVTAAYALGVPSVLGCDATPARTLVRTWGTSENLCLRRTAIIAYGSWLGAWDDACAAPVHLLRIGFETPRLRAEADRGLAELMSAGAAAQRIRELVVGLLRVAANDRITAPRAFGVLPLLFARLTGADASARESLEALRREEITRLQLVELLATALVSPGAYQAACAALHVVLAATATGRVDEEVTVALMRELRNADVGDKHDHLLSSLQRALEGEARRRDDVSKVALHLFDRREGSIADASA